MNYSDANGLLEYIDSPKFQRNCVNWNVKLNNILRFILSKFDNQVEKRTHFWFDEVLVCSWE